MTCVQKNWGYNDGRTTPKISDGLWDEIRIILPKEKLPKTLGPPIMKYRRVLDVVLYILRTRC